MAEYDPLYVAARTVLLDAPEALDSQRKAVIVVGAQAIYMRTGDTGISSVAPYTTDADLALAPGDLADEPLLEQLMRSAAFSVDTRQPGSWAKSTVVDGRSVVVPVDIMVPEGLAPPGGRRSVRIGPHDKMAARRTPGLEGAVVDNDVMEVAGLQDDGRHVGIRVAGSAALMVAKHHKLNDRLQAGQTDRIEDKDAGDVCRIMQAVSTDELLARWRPLLRHPLSEATSSAAVGFLGELFGARRSEGVQMAVRSLRASVPPERIEGVMTSFTRLVRDGLQSA